jgi:hypothetical protein
MLEELKKPKNWGLILLTFFAGFASSWLMNRPKEKIEITTAKTQKKSLEEILDLTTANNDYFLVKSICSKLIVENPHVDSSKLWTESGLKFFKLMPDSSIVFNKAMEGAGDGFFLGSFLQDYRIDSAGIRFEYRGDKLLKTSKINHRDTGLTLSVFLTWDQLKFCRK